LTPGRRKLAVGVQLVLAAAALWFAGLTLLRQWDDVRGAMLGVHLDWRYLLLSALVVLATYALLIAVWRATLATWGSRLAFWQAAEVWTISNLGRYVPGKVWQIGAMGMMAQRRGVSPVAAVGSALLLTLVNVLAGFGVVFATGARVLEAAGADRQLIRLGAVGTALLALALFASPVLLPHLATLARRMTGRAVQFPPLPARAVWAAAAGNVAAWLLYGLAFRLFATGVVGTATGGWAGYTAVFTGSYLIGYLVLVAPGGLVVREAAMIAGLAALGLATGAEATLLAVASRLWLTVLEIGPGALFLARAGTRPALRTSDDGTP